MPSKQRCVCFVRQQSFCQANCKDVSKATTNVLPVSGVNGLQQDALSCVFFYFYFLHELRVLFLLSSNENIQIFKYTESGSNVWPIYGSLPLPVQHGCPFCGPSGCPHPGSGLNNKLCCNNYDLISFNVTELKSFQDGQIGNREGFEWELMKLDRLDIYLNNSLSLWCYSDVVITHLNVFKGSFITFLQVCGGKYETCQAVLL